MSVLPWLVCFPWAGMHWFDVDSFVDSVSFVSEGGYGLNTHVKKNSRRPSIARKTVECRTCSWACWPSKSGTDTQVVTSGDRCSASLGSVHLIYTGRITMAPTQITKHNVPKVKTLPSYKYKECEGNNSLARESARWFRREYMGLA